MLHTLVNAVTKLCPTLPDLRLYQYKACHLGILSNIKHCSHHSQRSFEAHLESIIVFKVHQFLMFKNWTTWQYHNTTVLFKAASLSSNMGFIKTFD